MSNIKRILHVDIDAFFASVERAENPFLKNKKIVICGIGKRGVVTSASYEARFRGIRAGMPYYKSKRICPECIFLPVRHEIYEKYSKIFFDILHDFSPDVEVYSIDEAFIDVHRLGYLWNNDLQFAETLKKEIKRRIGLTVTVGIGDKKVCAKLATELAKPGGICKIFDEDLFLQNVEISKIPGIGRAISSKLYKKGIKTGKDIKYNDKFLWETIKCNFGAYVLSYEQRTLNKMPFLSVSRGGTFEEDTSDTEKILYSIAKFSEKVSNTLLKNKVKTLKVGLKMRYYNFEEIEGKQKVYPGICSYSEIFKRVKSIFVELYNPYKGKIRALSVFADKIIIAPDKYLFVSNKEEVFQRAVLSVKNKIGYDKIVPARILKK